MAWEPGLDADEIYMRYHPISAGGTKDKPVVRKFFKDRKDKEDGSEPDDEDFLEEKHDGGSLLHVSLKGQPLFDRMVQVEFASERGYWTEDRWSRAWAIDGPDGDGSFRLNLRDHVKVIMQGIGDRRHT
jgi:hypothetical protein